MQKARNVKTKNANIELMRFIFCLIVVFLHTGTRFCPEFNQTAPTFFKNGRIAVEFFFIVSGYLMMHSLSKVNNSLPIHKNTQSFVIKKVLGVFPYHLVIFLITEVVYFICKHSDFKTDIKIFFSFLPNFFLMQNIGFPEKKLITAEWYITAMFVSMFIICPFLLKFGKNFSRLFCPIASVMIIGMLVHSTGLVGAPNKFILGSTVMKGLPRAFAEICLGIFCYEVVTKLKTIELCKTGKTILTVAEFIGYAGCIYYTCSGDALKYDSYIVFVMAVAITITFSEKSYFHNKINPGLAGFLGKASLPLYLGQYLPYIIIQTLMPDFRFRYQLLFVIITDFALVPLTLFVGGKIQRKLIDYCKNNKLL